MGSKFQIVLKCSNFIGKHCHTRQTVRLDPLFQTHTFTNCENIGNIFYLPFCAKVCQNYCILAENWILGPKSGHFSSGAAHFKRAQKAQFLSKKTDKHIKTCAKVSAFERTLLECVKLSETFFIFIFVKLWVETYIFMAEMSDSEGQNGRFQGNFELPAALNRPLFAGKNFQIHENVRLGLFFRTHTFRAPSNVGNIFYRKKTLSPLLRAHFGNHLFKFKNF